jgi:CubicO group peptidase (beta-lactamase class C family)
VWDDAMRELVYEPLGLTHTVTLPERALRYRVAWGHGRQAGGPPTLVDAWELPRAIGPAGNICGRARDILALGQLFLDGGRGHDGSRILSPDLAAEMLRPQTAVPDRWVSGGHWGLGWRLHVAGGRDVYGHDGTGCGQCAFHVVVPDSNVAVALLTNGDSVDLGFAVLGQLLTELCGLELFDWPRPLPDAAGVRDGGPPLGTYERHGMRLQLHREDAGVRARLCAEPSPADDAGPEDGIELALSASSGGEAVYVTQVPGSRLWVPMVFFDLDGEQYVHFGGRAMHRTLVAP